MTFEYDVIVIGGGHAGCEASVASARLGAKTLLITTDLNRVAQMSCNPAVGGIAKGQIVREIDALGGQMGIISDKSAIQFRMLNRSKGPAVWSPRVQSDRMLFSNLWRRTLEQTPGLELFQDMVAELIVEHEDKPVIKGVKTALGITFLAKVVILTAGTFLNGLMHFGSKQMAGGRVAEEASYGISEQLGKLGHTVARMKTGTPMRIAGKSIDFSKTIPQSGEDIILDDGAVKRDFHKFSFLPYVHRELKPRDCFIVHTNVEAHEILRRNLDRSPLYNGAIKSIGPRYCPSIETKIVTFADKESHQLFLEPEGEASDEFYINGFSSSLPFDVQLESLQTIDALKDVYAYRPGYAIEYDFFDPTQLYHTLKSKLVDGLYMAGQVNGTTGYEEAAAQGLIAGINAALEIKSEHSFVLERDEAYIGVLIDDLVTKGVDEPYRMFTSRAEYRILLRQDDADFRLTPRGYAIGLVDDYRMEQMQRKLRLRNALCEFCESTSIRISEELNNLMIGSGAQPAEGSVRIASLLKRPQVGFKILCTEKKVMDRILQIDSDIRDEVVESCEILLKYEGYIKRERELAEKAKRLEYVKLPHDFDYAAVKALSTEARQKLSLIRPDNLGQAGRIPGVSPADISVLILMIGR